MYPSCDERYLTAGRETTSYLLADHGEHESPSF
jgi:hypothetical protein